MALGSVRLRISADFACETCAMNVWPHGPVNHGQMNKVNSPSEEMNPEKRELSWNLLLGMNMNVSGMTCWNRD